MARITPDARERPTGDHDHDHADHDPPLHRLHPFRHRGPRRDASDFPVQPSQKDGLGRMCKPHWREYTNALRKAAVARKAEAAEDARPEPEPGDESSSLLMRSSSRRTTPLKTRHSRAQAESADDLDVT